MSQRSYLLKELAEKTIAIRTLHRVLICEFVLNVRRALVALHRMEAATLIADRSVLKDLLVDEPQLLSVVRELNRSVDVVGRDSDLSIAVQYVDHISKRLDRHILGAAASRAEADYLNFDAFVAKEAALSDEDLVKAIAGLDKDARKLLDKWSLVCPGGDNKEIASVAIRIFSR